MDGIIVAVALGLGGWYVWHKIRPAGDGANYDASTH
jgi:hypothetical protein